jgi:hypothetical protein
MKRISHYFLTDKISPVQWCLVKLTYKYDEKHTVILKLWTRQLKHSLFIQELFGKFGKIKSLCMSSL